jgi:hypothetical protein
VVVVVGAVAGAGAVVGAGADAVVGVGVGMGIIPPINSAIKQKAGNNMKTLVEIEEHRTYNDRGELHNDTGPAIRFGNADGNAYEAWYRDGSLHRRDGPAIVYNAPPEGSAWAMDGEAVEFDLLVEHRAWWRGLEIPPHWITKRPQLEEIAAQTNDDMRAAAIDLYGMREYIRDIGATALDMEAGADGSATVLYNVPGLPYRILLAHDGSTRDAYEIAVPDTCKTCRDARIALNGAADCVAES